jgi:molybdopterin-binding protein
VMASVARLTGVENVFEAVVVQRSAAAGTMTVLANDESGSCYLDIPLGSHNRGDSVKVAIRSGDILLATGDLCSTSARNILPGAITAIEERGGYSIVRVKSGVGWCVSITRQAAEELSLSTGQKIWLAIKTHSCHLLDSHG